MRNLPALMLVGLTLTVTVACSKAAEAPTAPTPVGTPSPPTTVASVLTLQSDTSAPVGEAAAITYASRMQAPGKITVAVTGFNLQNLVNVGIGVFGVSRIEGRLKYDDTVLEIERSAEGIAAGDFMRQGGATGSCCLANGPLGPGLYPFFVTRGDNVQGSGELLLARFQPRAGVTSATTRIELVPFDVGPERGGIPYTTTLLLYPYGRRNMIDNTYGATITIRPGS